MPSLKSTFLFLPTKSFFPHPFATHGCRPFAQTTLSGYFAILSTAVHSFHVRIVILWSCPRNQKVAAPSPENRIWGRPLPARPLWSTWCDDLYVFSWRPMTTSTKTHIGVRSPGPPRRRSQHAKNHEPRTFAITWFPSSRPGRWWWTLAAVPQQEGLARVRQASW